jgi:hypothetical protein
MDVSCWHEAWLAGPQGECPFVARRGRDPFATPNIAAVAKLAMQGCAQAAINRSDSQQQGLNGLPQNIYKSVS